MESDEMKIARLEKELADEKTRSTHWRGEAAKNGLYKHLYEELLDKVIDKLN